MDKTVYPFKYWCFIWKLLIHIEQGGHRRPFNHLPAECNTEKERWGETHESLILDSCCMLNYPIATVQGKAEEESIIMYIAQILPVCESSARLINMDSLFLIRCLWLTTMDNNSITAVTITVRVVITSHRWWRKNEGESSKAVDYLCHSVTCAQISQFPTFCGIAVVSVQSPY